ncbi:MAG: 50S ribosomal protein L25, partial [Planctomycetes bacterium]|nr:50S ribosomal protein L25 [Planctomycetota bacterium]
VEIEDEEEGVGEGLVQPEVIGREEKEEGEE